MGEAGFDSYDVRPRLGAIRTRGLRMAKKASAATTNPTCCAPGTCRVEAVVPVDDRGQMVLPKGLRKPAGIRSGDRLAVVSCELGDRVCCPTLLRADELSASVKQLLGPMGSEILTAAWANGGARPKN